MARRVLHFAGNARHRLRQSRQHDDESVNSTTYTLTVTGTATGPTGNALVHYGPQRYAGSDARCALYPGPSMRSRKNSATPPKKTSAMRTPGSRFTSGTRSVAAT